MKRRCVLKICFIASSVLVLIAAPALAGTQTVLDPDDSESVLDTVAVRHRPYELDVTTSEGGFIVPVIRLRLITYETWSPSVVSGPRSFISFEFNRDRDRDIERCLVIRESDSRLMAQLFKNCRYDNDTAVTKPYEAFRGGDEHAVEVSIGRRQVAGKGRHRYSWRSVTSYETPTQSSLCPAPTPPEEAGYGSCVDVTRWKSYRF